MELTVLGAGPAYTDRPGASGACYLVRDVGGAILLDLGQGSFPRIFEHVEPSALAGILISHLHPDHFVDLVPLRHYLRFEFSPSRRMPVHADAGLTERLDGLHGDRGFTAAALDVVPLAVGMRTVGPFEVEAIRVTHTADSYAFRVAPAPGPVPGADAGSSGVEAPSGAALVYSGDVGLADDLVPLIHPGDTLLVEVSFGPGPSDPAAQHLDGSEVGRIAVATRAGRVLLTHLQMGNDAEETIRSVKARYGGPVTLVEPGFRTET